MNIIEAVKSGKRMRRPEYKENSWVIVAPQNKLSQSLIFVWDDSKDAKVFCISDIMSDDWEIEEKKAEISSEQLVSTIMRSGLTGGLSRVVAREMALEVAKELGL